MNNENRQEETKLLKRAFNPMGWKWLSFRRRANKQIETMAEPGKVREKECVSAGPLQVILVAVISTVT